MWRSARRLRAAGLATQTLSRMSSLEGRQSSNGRCISSPTYNCTPHTATPAHADSTRGTWRPVRGVPSGLRATDLWVIRGNLPFVNRVECQGWGLLSFDSRPFSPCDSRPGHSPGVVAEFPQSRWEKVMDSYTGQAFREDGEGSVWTCVGGAGAMAVTRDTAPASYDTDSVLSGLCFGQEVNPTRWCCVPSYVEGAGQSLRVNRPVRARVIDPPFWRAMFPLTPRVQDNPCGCTPALSARARVISPPTSNLVLGGRGLGPAVGVLGFAH